MLKIINLKNNFVTKYCFNFFDYESNTMGYFIINKLTVRKLCLDNKLTNDLDIIGKDLIVEKNQKGFYHFKVRK